MIEALKAKKEGLVKELEGVCDKIAALDLKKEAILLKVSVIDELIEEVGVKACDCAGECTCEAPAPVGVTETVEQEGETIVIHFGKQNAEADTDN